jgi:hypothetical protein
MIKDKYLYFFISFFIIFFVSTLFIVGYNNLYSIKNPYINNQKSRFVNLEGLSVSDLVAAKLTYATSGIEPFELAIFGNSRSVMLGGGDISQWKDGHSFNFSVGGTAFQQSVRSLEYLAHHGVAPKTAVISIDNAELQFVGPPYWPAPLFDGFRIIQDIWSLLDEDYSGSHQRIKDAVKLTEYFAGWGWAHFKLEWNFDTMRRRGKHFIATVEDLNTVVLSNSIDGSRRQNPVTKLPNLKAFKPETSAPRAENRYLLIGLRRLADLMERYGTRIIVYESPLAPDLASIYTARPTVVASETRRWMKLGCVGTGIECHSSPVLPNDATVYWPDCCHAPAAILGEYVSGLIAQRRPK